MSMQPEEFVKNVFIAIALLKALTSIFPIRDQRNLGFEVLFTETFKSLDSTGELGRQMRYPQNHDTGGYAALIEIKNSGKLPITKEDFVTPLSFSFGDKATVLEAHIVKQVPPDLLASLAIVDSVVRLNPLLLNPADSVVFGVLVDGGRKKVRASGRIVGISRIKKHIPKNTEDIVTLIGLLFLLSGLVLNNVGKQYESVGEGLSLVGFVMIMLYPRFVYPQRRLVQKRLISRLFRKNAINKNEN